MAKSAGTPRSNQNSAAHAKYSGMQADEFLKNHGTFSQLPRTELKTLADACRFTTVRSGEYITNEGEEDPAGFIVASGRLAMLKSSLSGKQLVVELLRPGDIFGLLLMLEKSPAQLSARAQVRSKVLWMPISNLIGVLTIHPAIYKEFAAGLLESLHSSHRISRGLAHDRVEVRIAAILSSLALKFARPVLLGEVQGKFPIIDITRQQLAELTGTTSESAIRITRALQHQGIIDVSSPGVIKVLDLVALQKLSET